MVAPWTPLATREVFADPRWLRVLVQQVRLPDGRVIDDFYRVALPDYAVIVPFTDDGRIVVERHYKHGVGAVTLSAPAGMIGDGEAPLDGARRELLEETGYVADNWESLGTFTVNGNQGCGRAHLFRALGAHRVTDPASGDLEEIEVVLMTLAEIAVAMRKGDVHVLSSIAAIAMATHPLFTEPQPADPMLTTQPRSAMRTTSQA